MPKQCSTRSTTEKRRTGRATRMVGDGEIRPDAVLLPSETSEDNTKMARQLVLASWPAILEGLIKKAKAGGHQQAKFLLDVYDLTDADASEANEQRKQQLCDVLLDSLKLSSGMTDEAADDTH